MRASSSFSARPLKFGPDLKQMIWKRYSVMVGVHWGSNRGSKRTITEDFFSFLYFFKSSPNFGDLAQKLEDALISDPAAKKFKSGIPFVKIFHF